MKKQIDNGAATAPRDAAEDMEQVFVELKKLPDFGRLAADVNAVVRSASWWQRYGIDWMQLALAGAAIPLALFLLSSDNRLTQLSGVLCWGWVHAAWANKAGHLAVHGGLADSPAAGRFWARFFIDFWGTFSAEAGHSIHVKMHHGHTNIVGLGDSSTWKVTFLSRYPYMFLAPFAIPLLTPIAAISELLSQPRQLLSCLSLMSAGLYLQLYLLVTAAGCQSYWTALVLLFAMRSVYAIPYLHVNIFQHIGLPMYDPDHRPVRLFQMSTGVLNLSRNILLEAGFGHSLISCHVEHHLFPFLSDNMCLTIKPFVRRFLMSHGLPYHEDSYTNRLSYFLEHYEKLLVHAPTIVHFVGLP